jgi:hypothetical protein
MDGMLCGCSGHPHVFQAEAFFVVAWADASAAVASDFEGVSTLVCREAAALSLSRSLPPSASATIEVLIREAINNALSAFMASSYRSGCANTKVGWHKL